MNPFYGTSLHLLIHSSIQVIFSVNVENKKQEISVAFVDLTKAFDSINPEALWCGGRVHVWVSCHLCDNPATFPLESDQNRLL